MAAPKLWVFWWQNIKFTMQFSGIKCIHNVVQPVTMSRTFSSTSIVTTTLLSKEVVGFYTPLSRVTASAS